MEHLHSLGESRGWNGRAIRVDQTNAIETALKQIFGRKPKAFAKTSSALREQIEVGRQYVCVSPFPTDRSINCNGACFSKQSSTRNCRRNRSRCITQKTSVKRSRFIPSQRRDKTRFHSSGPRCFGHHC